MMLSKSEQSSIIYYMCCVCEGVVDQLISGLLDKSNSKQSFYLHGSQVEEISKELTAVTLTCEITRKEFGRCQMLDGRCQRLERYS